KFAAGDGQVASLGGARQLGCSLIVVPPGKRAYPFHCHHVNEEMFVILEGSGTLRLGESEQAVGKGDVIFTPAGGAETAHQLINTGATELRYLAVSTMLPGDVVEYLDSGKVGVYVGSTPGGDRSQVHFRFHGKLGQACGYWDGE